MRSRWPASAKNAAAPESPCANRSKSAKRSPPKTSNAWSGGKPRVPNRYKPAAGARHKYQSEWTTSYGRTPENGDVPASWNSTSPGSVVERSKSNGRLPTLPASRAAEAKSSLPGGRTGLPAALAPDLTKSTASDAPAAFQALAVK